MPPDFREPSIVVISGWRLTGDDRPLKFSLTLECARKLRSFIEQLVFWALCRVSSGGLYCARSPIQERLVNAHSGLESRPDFAYNKRLQAFGSTPSL